MPARFLAVAAAAALVVAAWPQARPVAQAGAAPLTFTDVTAAAGIHFRHTSGAFGKKYLPETMGAGVVVLDFDNDGRQDLFFANGRTWPGRPPVRSLPALYRSTGAGTFTDVTQDGGARVRGVRDGRARPPTTTTTGSWTCS